jgi:hypothetical protein
VRPQRHHDYAHDDGHDKAEEAADEQADDEHRSRPDRGVISMPIRSRRGWNSRAAARGTHDEPDQQEADDVKHHDLDQPEAGGLKNSARTIGRWLRAPADRVDG